MKSVEIKCRLKELRMSRGLTQTGIAMELNVSQQTISRIEMEESEIPIDLAVKAAEYFSVSVEYILGLSEERRLTSVVNRALHISNGHEDFMMAYMALSPENQERVTDLVDDLWNLQKTYEAEV